MKLFIASDHAAFSCKEELKKSFHNSWEFLDLGTQDSERTDYPIYAKRLVQSVLKTGGQGVLLCGSGIGVCMVANRYQGIRAALVSCVDTARLAREHNDANVLCMGGRSHKVNEIKLMIETWVKASFEGGRYQKRLDLFSSLGEAFED